MASLLRVCLLSTLLVVTGCAYGPYHTDARVGVHGYYDSYYDDFYFYPDVSVYFNLRSHDYYYRPRPKEAWVRVDRLPPGLRLEPKHRIEVRAHRDRPYDGYREHYDRYRQERHR